MKDPSRVAGRDGLRLVAVIRPGIVWWLDLDCAKRIRLARVCQMLLREQGRTLNVPDNMPVAYVKKAGGWKGRGLSSCF